MTRTISMSAEKDRLEHNQRQHQAALVLAETLAARARERKTTLAEQAELRAARNDVEYWDRYALGPPPNRR